VTSGEGNTEIARRAYAALNRGDLEGFLALVDPEVEFQSLVAEAEGQTYHGHAGVREWWKKVAQALGGLHFEPQEIRDHGDCGYSRIVVTGTVAGVEVPQTMWQAFRLVDGKPIWWATYRTEAEARESLGLFGDKS
jgi:ketosteroid isomerase-like protein